MSHARHKVPFYTEGQETGPEIYSCEAAQAVST